MSGSNAKSSENHLNEQEQIEIIHKLSKPNPSSKHSIAQEYFISEGSIRYIWNKKDEFGQRSLLMTAEARASTFRQSKGHFPQNEQPVYTWIDTMRWANLTVQPSYAIAKDKMIAASLEISDDDFKGSWQWLRNFRTCYGFQEILLHGEGVEVNKNDPKFLTQLESLYEIIKEYNA